MVALHAQLAEGMEPRHRLRRVNISSLLAAGFGRRSAKSVRILRHHPEEAFLRHERSLNTTLHIFVRNGDAKVVEMLLRAGVSVRSVNNQAQVALHRAQSAAVLRLLLAHGAHVDVNSVDSDGYAGNTRPSHPFLSMTPLHCIIRSGEAEAVRLLIDAGARVNAPTPQGWSPLMLASSACRLDVVQLLLRSGADPYAVDLERRDALDHALERLNTWQPGDSLPRLVMVLASAGMHRSRDDLVWKRVRYVYPGPLHLRVVELLITHSMLDPLRALHSNSLFLRTPMIGLLLRHGLDPNAHSSPGVPLGSHSDDSHAAFLLLIIAGLDLDARCVGNNPGTFRAKAKSFWPELTWDAPRPQILRQCAALCRREMQPHLRLPHALVLDGLLMHKIP